MNFVRSTLAGAGAVIVTALAVYGLIYGFAVGAPLIWKLIPSHHGSAGTYTYAVGPFPMWTLAVLALLIFSGGFYGSFRKKSHRRGASQGLDRE
jgi:hypothetical protein